MSYLKFRHVTHVMIGPELQTIYSVLLGAILGAIVVAISSKTTDFYDLNPPPT